MWKGIFGEAPFYIFIYKKNTKQDKNTGIVPVPALHISDYTETKTVCLLSILAEVSCTKYKEKKNPSEKQKNNKQKNKKKAKIKTKNVDAC